MRWTKLTVQNFLSFKEFTLELDNRGVILVEGVNETSNKFKSNGSGKCVRGNQRIYDMDNQRYIPIKDFVKDKVSTTLGVVNYKTDIVKVTDWHKLGKKKIYKVTTDTGSCIEVAETHPILTEVGCKPVKDIAVGDWVAEVRELKQGGRPEIAYSDILWTKVKSIEYLGEDDCYDITVDTPDHLYVCENFVVHNSSLLEPLVYAIYNTTSKGMKADEVVNLSEGKNTAVILEGYKGNDLYRIERYRKHKKHKNKVKLFVNDKEITEKSADATNEAIKRLVGIDYNTFVNSIMFSQGSGAGRFAIATDKEKKEILENVVNLTIYAKAQEVAKDRVKKKEAEIEAKKREGERLNWELAQVDTLEEQDRQQYQTTLDMIKQEEDNVKANVDQLSEYIQKNLPVVEKIREYVGQLKEKRDSMTNIDIASYADEVSKYKSQLDEFSRKINQYTYQKEELVKQYKQLQQNTHCPVCGNELDATHRDKEMEVIKSKLRDVLINIQTLEKQSEPLKDKYQQALDKYNHFKPLYDEGMAAFNKVIQEIEAREKQIRGYENTVQSLKNKQKNTLTTLEKLRKVPEPRSRESERESIREKIKAFKKELLALEQEKTKLENVVKVYSNSGVKSHILDLVTPFLNERANKYLATLSGTDMELKFDTQKENKNGEKTDKFEVELINHAGGDKYKSNSEGEKKRADIAIALALQDLVMSKGDTATNFVVYDEVFDALDSVGAENVVELLRERSKVVNTIFVITHSEHLKPLFDKTITVVKGKDKISRIHEGAETT